MTIVPIGNLILQGLPSDSLNYAAELSVVLQEQIQLVIARSIEAVLKEEVDRFLERRWYERRRRVKHRKVKERCNRCMSHDRQKFRRNGHYLRCLNTKWGQVWINMPQIKCACGGNVPMSYRVIRPRQRMWDDFDLEVRVDYNRGLSYRQIKADWDERLGGSIGLRTLNRRVLQTDKSTKLWKQGEAPPVVRVDGIWITLMFATGEVKKDRLGRSRAVKRAKKVPILVAQGVWPLTGRTAPLAWMRADSEDTDSWQKFLEQLYDAGITPENGLALLVADGSSGFRSAYENRYWMVPLQRCVFHKLRNISEALRIPAGLNRKAAREYRTQFLRQAARIWQAQDVQEARLLYHAFCQEWLASQPKAIATLSRDFDETLTFFAIQEQAAELGQIWSPQFLRTTSHLERRFREFRRRYRNAILFHSEAGAQAATVHLVNRFS